MVYALLFVLLMFHSIKQILQIIIESSCSIKEIKYFGMRRYKIIVNFSQKLFTLSYITSSKTFMHMLRA